ncbi:glycogen debranching protein GlgX [Neisseria brasiliensis]|uniref:glycogen debranching protein GlgX n=1 Tax=Neisseria TaxID=482 RepID=UPI000C27D3F2|nr:MULTISPECIES: glycogen debranching protein GlgX [Neisseria]PJO77818.1 glycogen debranching enzyme GlgX [Neisseria sp. N177_16]QGL25806.1 glycogen debranching protein GlgX [Neisseria brasiliensis]
MNAEAWHIEAGRPYPLGVSLRENGANFAVFSYYAQSVELCLFDGEKETRLELPCRSGTVFYGFVPNIKAGQRYGFRVYGQGYGAHCAFFNPQKLLIDPYSKQIDGVPQYRNEKEMAWFHHTDGRDNAAIAPKSVVVPPSDFDWGDDRHPDIAWGDTVIYEAHVKGFTKKFPDLANAGTYQALADKRVIAYLKKLGITTIELLPIHQHLDEYHLQKMGLSNYWGYNTYSHFAVEPDYAANPDNAADEFRQAAKALHAAGIEVILDVVYNHTAEQDIEGPTLCQRGMDNSLWYWQDAQYEYENWSGCGNTLKVVNRDISRWVMDSLRYWVEEFHVDGFRFDLGTILGREPAFKTYGRFFNMLFQDPLLAGRKMIAEAWDIGEDGYHVGKFPQPFAEWNGLFRDDMRAFWSWENGNLGAFAERLSGSADMFDHSGRLPSASINFITAHDGFTLQDLVSYNEKHNESNGELNRDGHNENFSYNHGVEGESDDPCVLQSREYTVKALLASLFLSAGTPMLLSGDEFSNSQQGNNNGYCQDNAITWLDWLSETHVLQDYVHDLIEIRKKIKSLNADKWWDKTHVTWLNSDGLEMTDKCWNDHSVKAMQVLLDDEWLLLVNGKRSTQLFNLPQGSWKVSCVPSEKFNYEPMAQQCEVSHMGIWVLRKASKA